MSAFSNSELARYQVIGVAALVVGIVLTIAGAWARWRGLGVPEYITCLRGSGILICLVSLAWIALASIRRIAQS